MKNVKNKTTVKAIHVALVPVTLNIIMEANRRLYTPICITSIIMFGFNREALEYCKLKDTSQIYPYPNCKEV